MYLNNDEVQALEALMELVLEHEQCCREGFLLDADSTLCEMFRQQFQHFLNEGKRASEESTVDIAIEERWEALD